MEILNQLGVKLSLEEKFAIRWHMGMADDAVKGGSYALNAAIEKFPLIALTIMADEAATWLDEGKEADKNAAR